MWGLRLGIRGWGGGLRVPGWWSGFEGLGLTAKGFGDQIHKELWEGDSQVRLGIVFRIRGLGFGF